VADASFGTGAVALQMTLGASGTRLLASGDEYALWDEVAEGVVGRREREAAVQRNLLGCEPERVELGDGLGQQRVLAGIARQRRCRQDQSARTTPGVGATSAICATYPNSVGLPSLPCGSAGHRDLTTR
jgi:hypothetical protein